MSGRGPTPITFAVPGDIDALTGGYIYEKSLLIALRDAGWDVAHLRLPGSYPDVTPADEDATIAALAALPADRPILMDGFLTGATDPTKLAQVAAPYVAICHHPLASETGIDPARAARLHEIERANLGRAAHVLVPSPHTAKALTRDYGVRAERLTVALPGLARPALGAVPKAAPPLILAVGQLVPRKGHDVLLKALATLTDLDWQATILGGPTEPTYASELDALRTELGLSDRVTFGGLVGPDVLSTHYAQARLFALATHYEGYGMVFAEALAHGLPIVSCVGGAVPDTVPPDAGLLSPPGDVPAFAAHLRQLLEDPARLSQMADAALAHGRALPTWADTARIASEVLTRVQP